jgi:hypothetical protein
MKYITYLLTALIITSSLPLMGDGLPTTKMYINKGQEGSLDASQTRSYKAMATMLSKNLLQQVDDEFFHQIGSIDIQNNQITLTDGSIWQINKNYANDLLLWAPQDRLKISYFPDQASNMKIVNMTQAVTVWGILKKSPENGAGDEIINVTNETDFSTVMLRSGWSFVGPAANSFGKWQINDSIFIFHSENGYDLCNMTKKIWVKGCTIQPLNAGQGFETEIMTLESRLNNRVLAQATATKALADALISYKAGLKNPESPIGVFLFLGPTGVGKTELAKALSIEYYKNSEKLLRFDMSHFAESHTVSRLIGSPPGYVNHEEGGQLSEPLKKSSQAIVLLDEIEKANPIVRKFFLPIFDDGHFKDAKNINVPCQDVIFIMTSNLASDKITRYVNLGYSDEDILTRIEPVLTEQLSPELYNRVQPIIFHPLKKEDMQKLVDLMLKDTLRLLKQTKNIDLFIDASAKEYLVKHGFHPTLGARPLRRLIEQKITRTLAYALVSRAIPNGSTITLSYQPLDDSWHVDF